MTFAADLRVCRAKRGRLVLPRAGKVLAPLGRHAGSEEPSLFSSGAREYLCYRVNQLPVLKHGPRSSLHLQVRSHGWCMGQALSYFGAPLSESLPRDPFSAGRGSGDRRINLWRSLLLRPRGGQAYPVSQKGRFIVLNTADLAK